MTNQYKKVYLDSKDKNPLNDDALLAEIFTKYTDMSGSRKNPKKRNLLQHRTASELYSLLTKKNKIGTQTNINFNDYEKYNVMMTNEWIKNIKSLHPKRIERLEESGLNFQILLKYLSNIDEVNTLEDIDNLYNDLSKQYKNESHFEKYYFWRQYQGEAGFFKDAYYFGDFEHVKSTRLGLGDVYSNDIEHRIYINISNEYLFKFLMIYVEYCKKYKIPFYYKFDGNNSRSDKFLIYGSKEIIEKNITILKEIQTRYPQMIKSFGKPPVLTMNVDNWFGISSEPDYQKLNCIHSFHTLRAEIFEDAAERLTIRYIKARLNHSSGKQFLEELVEVAVKSIFGKNDNYSYISNIKKQLSETNNGLPKILEAINTYEKNIEFKNDPDAYGSYDNLIDVYDINKKDIHLTYSRMTKILKQIAKIIIQTEPEYIKKYREEIKKECISKNVDPDQIALNLDFVKELLKNDQQEEKIEYAKKALQSIIPAIEKLNNYESIFEYLKYQTINNIVPKLDENKQYRTDSGIVYNLNDLLKYMIRKIVEQTYYYNLNIKDINVSQIIPK